MTCSDTLGRPVVAGGRAVRNEDAGKTSLGIRRRLFQQGLRRDHRIQQRQRERDAGAAKNRAP